MPLPATQRVITTKRHTIVLIGTAHISQQSAEEVEGTIDRYRPDCVCIELDAKRLKALSGGDRWRNLDIRQIIKRKEGALLLASILMSNFQRRIGKQLNVEPGLEMKTATKVAKARGIPLILCDRNIRTTMLRVWRLSRAWNKLRLFSMILSPLFERRAISEQEIEALKQEDALGSLLAELSSHFPLFKRVILEERDRYLAIKIYHALATHNTAVAVVGAGHLVGVHTHLERLLAAGQEASTEELDRIPPASRFGRLLRIAISVALVALIVSGFFFGGAERGLQNITYWVLVNGIAAALGSLLALAHPITIILSALCAPLTSLNPTIGVGFVAALIESVLRKPRARDLQNVGHDSQSVRGFYRNRITKILLVFLLSSLGSAIGTFVALPLLLG